MRVMTRCLGGVVGRQRPDPDWSGWATRARTDDTKKGRLELPTSGPGATITGGTGQNGLNRFKIQTIQKRSFFPNFN
jgi:hypothetical protein